MGDTVQLCVQVIAITEMVLSGVLAIGWGSKLADSLAPKPSGYLDIFDFLLRFVAFVMLVSYIVIFGMATMLFIGATWPDDFKCRTWWWFHVILASILALDLGLTTVRVKSGPRQGDMIGILIFSVYTVVKLCIVYSFIASIPSTNGQGSTTVV